LDTETLILAGFAGNICVLFTANDAYMRNFKLIVPSDCIGSNTTEVNELFFISIFEPVFL
jgi:nicotinamidase-related amidase